MKDYVPSVFCRQMTSFLDCPCQPFGPMRDDGPLIESSPQTKLCGNA